MEAIWGSRRFDRHFPRPPRQALASLQPQPPPEQQQQQQQARQQQAGQQVGQQAGGEDAGRQRSRDELLRDVQELVLPGTTAVDSLSEDRV